MPKPVTNKKDFVRRFMSGEFGNRAPVWDEPPGILNYERFYHIRNRIAGGPTLYNVYPYELYESWVRMGIINGGYDTLYVSEMAPHYLGTVQGEVRESVNHVDLTITTGKLPMREALATDYTTFLTGLRAIMLLRHFMNHKSYEWLQWLFEGYPDHVIEFTCFSECWGTEPGYNTIFWETRLY